MWWFAKMRLALLPMGALLAVLLASGCYDSAGCPAEQCDHRDNDCDGRVDEDFRDADGFYATTEHCGGCGVRCDRVFPTAAETSCEVDIEEEVARCALAACGEGQHPVGDGACAPDVPVLCLPCEAHADCEERLPGSRCVEVREGDRRCATSCTSSESCPGGFECSTVDGIAELCVPENGVCACTEAMGDVELGCSLRSDESVCAGVRRCAPEGLTECEPALPERCNQADEDCDGEVDEDFRNDAGDYVAVDHCGGCNRPCVAPGPNMRTACVAAEGVTCLVECEEGFVDVDGLDATGCECQRRDMGGIPVVGGDADCDGVPDDNQDFVFVSPLGNDDGSGALSEPLRTLAAGMELGAQTGKPVLVAQGSYRGPVDLMPGVSIFGGYSSDFRDRDLELFSTVISGGVVPGRPLLRCSDVQEATRMDGFTVIGADATDAGAGSTAVYLDGCGSAVELTAMTVLAGHGADGTRGADSSERLGADGVPSLEQLAGVDGRTGRPGGTDGSACSVVLGGVGGSKTCPGGTDAGGGDGGDGECPDLGCVNGEPCGNAGCTDFTSDGDCDFDAVLAAAVPNEAPASGRGPQPGDAGEATFNSPTNRGICNFCDDNPTLPREGDNGGDGAAGVDGDGGDGGSGRRFDVGLGLTAGRSGSFGETGTHGSGGGGGSAGAGYAVIGGTSGTCQSVAGGSGGGGGSGGCGAPGAGGGQGGGGSIGIVVRLADGQTAGPTLSDVRVVTGNGGNGGDGGIGASGGAGGVGALGGVAQFWCARNGGRGGDGGRGGAGGGGGGGAGGASLGLLVAGGSSDYVDALQERAAVEQAGSAGRGGAGGFSPGARGGRGTDGISATIIQTP